jgi:hypothetical protein
MTDAPCMVNHELADDLFLALLARQRETEAMLRRAMPLIKRAVHDTPYWGEAETLVKEADEFLERIDVGEIKMPDPNAEPL